MLAICDDEFQISFQYSNDIHEIDTKLTSLVIEQRWKMDETKEFSHDWLITPWIINQSDGRSIFLSSLSLPSFYWDISLSTFVNHPVDRWDWAIGDKINCRTKSIDNSVFFFLAAIPVFIGWENHQTNYFLFCCDYFVSFADPPETRVKKRTVYCWNILIWASTSMQSVNLSQIVVCTVSLTRTSGQTQLLHLTHVMFSFHHIMSTIVRMLASLSFFTHAIPYHTTHAMADAHAVAVRSDIYV